MEKRYWMHRISHEWEVSYTLFNMGYLSIGWRCFAGSDLLQQIQDNGEQGFHAFMADRGETRRSRWGLWRFSQFAPGDRIVVPLSDKAFSVVEVIEPAFPVSALSGIVLTTENREPADVREDGIYNRATGCCYDIGFLVKVKRLRNDIKRSFADAKLVSRMKLRQTNACITELADSVEAALQAKAPVSIHAALAEAAAEEMKKVIMEHVTPDQLEHLVYWYMKKKGASHVQTPAKNESGKENGADADVIAKFDDFRIIFYIQVKKHASETETGEWAVQQISEYKRQKQNEDDDYTYIPWVISTASFSDTAFQNAKENGVRLIDGNDFIRMLMDCGLDGIEF